MTDAPARNITLDPPQDHHTTTTTTKRSAPQALTTGLVDDIALSISSSLFLDEHHISKSTVMVIGYQTMIDYSLFSQVMNCQLTVRIPYACEYISVRIPLTYRIDFG